MGATQGDFNSSPVDVENQNKPPETSNPNDDESNRCVKLEKDTYTMMFLSNGNIIVFLLSLATFVFQVTILGIVISEQLEPDETGEWLMIPHRTSSLVAVCQIVALIIAVMNLDDITLSISLLAKNPGNFTLLYKGKTEGAPETNHCLWYLSNFGASS